MQRPSILTAACLALTVAPSAVAQSTVSPGSRAAFEGSQSTSFPLGRHDARIQQIHDDLGPAPATLRGHAYRRDAESLRAVVGGFDATIEVIVSTAPHAAAAASATFAANHGADRVTVLPPTTISFPATDRPPTAPAPTFDLRIPWATSFAYPGGVPLCIEVVVHGNRTASGNDRNFSALLDAHGYGSDGSSATPGYRYGGGCAPAGATRDHEAILAMVARPDGTIGLDVDSRRGVPGPTAFPALLFGIAPAAIPLPIKPTCFSFTSAEVGVGLPVPIGIDGAWRAEIPGFGGLPPGASLYAQVAHLAPGADLTMSEGSVLAVPVLPPASVPVARISSGSDRTAATGTVSTVAAVVEFF